MSKITIAVNLLRLTLILEAAVSVFYFSWFNLVISVLTLALTYFPIWFEKKYRIDIPLDFELTIVLFVYASLFLGEVVRFYEYFWWWDTLLHAISAVAFSLIGFIILLVLFQTEKIRSKPIWIAFFSFCFSVCVAAIWEIMEFSVDQVFGANMQKSGLMDTMWDLIVASIGAGLASMSGFAYMKGGQHSAISRLVKVFFRDNPELRRE